MKKRNIIATFILSVVVNMVAQAQFNVSLTSGINNTAYGVGENLLTRFPNQASIPIGLDMQLSIHKHAKSSYVALRTGASYLHSGYDYFRNDPTLSFSTSSELSKKYLRIPFTIRVYFQPMPLVERFTLFIGGGVSIHKPLSIELSETYTTGAKTVKDTREVSSLASATYVFGLVEAGVSYRRLQVSFRFGQSTTNMYIAGIDRTWKVPSSQSYYLTQHREAGEGYEKHRELVLSIQIF